MPVEGDDLGIATGVLVLVTTGDVFHPLLYRYHPQPGTYWLTAVAHALLGLGPAQSLALLALVSGLVLWWGSAAFTRGLAGIPWVLGAFTPLLIQELWVASYFGNSAMPAAAVVSLSLLLAHRPKDNGGVSKQKQRPPGPHWEVFRAILAGILLALATWIRFDAVLLLPAVVWATWVGARLPIRTCAFLAAAFAIVLTLMIFYSRVSPAEIFVQGSSHVVHFAQLRQSLISWAAWGSVPFVILMILGLRRLWVGKAWEEFTLVSLGFVPPALVYGWNLTTPKYLLYIVPFTTRLACHGWLEVLKGSQITRRWLIVLLGGTFGAQFLVGPLTFIQLITGRNWTLAGTHDGPRRVEGLLWSPLDWYQAKTKIAEELPKIRSHLGELALHSEHLVFLTDDWFSSRWIRLYLLEEGFYPTECRRHFAFIPVPGHTDFCLFRSGQMDGFSHRSRSGAKAGVEIACFETEWLEASPEKPPLWAELWHKWTQAPNVLIVWISGRRSTVTEVREAWTKLGFAKQVEIQPLYRGRTRPWLFLVKGT
ncbi:MAG: hypothetical protein NZ899_09865 [Thermoguttaceae bacterium]|nr:hypothetical protein [Thermoguttaceae bacterium]MDW8077564.1 hypothetical protein [Thermoguttaceae bacterium]